MDHQFGEIKFPQPYHEEASTHVMLSSVVDKHGHPTQSLSCCFVHPPVNTLD